jgi:four helix bundle protein
LGASYRELEVWAKAMDVAEAIYAAAPAMPKQEEYRLTAQMIRAAISIPREHRGRARPRHAQGIRTLHQHCTRLVRRVGDAPAFGHANQASAAGADKPLLEDVERVARMLNRLHARLKDV